MAQNVVSVRDVSGNLHGALGQAEPVPRDGCGRSWRLGGAESHEQGRIVLSCRVGVSNARRSSEACQRVNVATVKSAGRPVVELGRPGGRRRIEPEVAQERQAMREKPAADDQHALIAKWAQRGSYSQ